MSQSAPWPREDTWGLVGPVRRTEGGPGLRMAPQPSLDHPSPATAHSRDVSQTEPRSRRSLVRSPVGQIQWAELSWEVEPWG